MDASLLLGLIGTITGIASLTLYWFEIYKNKPEITVRVLKKQITLLEKNNWGEEEPFNFYLEEDFEVFATDPEFGFQISLILLFNNKGNKKTTINKIAFRCSNFTREFDVELIPLDVGESYKGEYSFKVVKIEDRSMILNKSCHLLVIDNREKAHKVTIEELHIG